MFRTEISAGNAWQLGRGLIKGLGDTTADVLLDEKTKDGKTPLHFGTKWSAQLPQVHGEVGV